MQNLMFTLYIVLLSISFLLSVPLHTYHINLEIAVHASILFSLVDAKPVDFVNSCRMKHGDFDVVKVIGRGAFGEVQLVSESMSRCHKST